MSTESDTSFHMTGNEDDASFHLITKYKYASYRFYKTITINHELDYDIYEETFYFPAYSFTVFKHIEKLSKYDITLEFIANFHCTFDDINDDNITNISVWNTAKSGPVKYWPTPLIEPNDVLKQFSVQLYDKYVEYYQSAVQSKLGNK